MSIFNYRFEDGETPLNEDNLNQILDACDNLDAKIDEILDLPSEKNDKIIFINSSEGITGTLQSFIVPNSGVYHIKAAGASGGLGHNANSYGLQPGNGATLEADFDLQKDDELIILTGQKGGDGSGIYITGGPIVESASGGGGGATLVLKKISAITDSTYQFTKNDEHFEILMVVAGGAGTGDPRAGGDNYTIGGMPGGAAGAKCYSPSNYVAWSNVTWISGYNSSCPYEGGGGIIIIENGYGGSIKHFIDNDSVGGTLKHYSTDMCLGGYGGGSAASKLRPSGGGWTTVNNAKSGVCSTSWCLGRNKKGTDGDNEGHGFCEIYCKQLNIIITDGDGTKYLADDGTYKEIVGGGNSGGSGDSFFNDVYNETSSSYNVRTCLIPNVTNYDQLLGKTVKIKANWFGHTIACSLNINSLGAKSIRFNNGSSLASMASAPWVASGGVYQVVWNGTDFICLTSDPGIASWARAGYADSSMIPEARYEGADYFNFEQPVYLGIQSGEINLITICLGELYGDSYYTHPHTFIHYDFTGSDRYSQTIYIDNHLGEGHVTFEIESDEIKLVENTVTNSSFYAMYKTIKIGG